MEKEPSLRIKKRGTYDWKDFQYHHKKGFRAEVTKRRISLVYTKCNLWSGNILREDRNSNLSSPNLFFSSSGHARQHIFGIVDHQDSICHHHASECRALITKFSLIMVTQAKKYVRLSKTWNAFFIILFRHVMNYECLFFWDLNFCKFIN